MTNQYNNGIKWVLPAEWELQSAVQLTWPHAQTDWQPYLESIIKTEVELAKNIAKYEHVLIVTQDVVSTKQYFTEEELVNITLFQCDINDTWARDHAFITLQQVGNSNAVKLLDFKFNGWGSKFCADKDTLINNKMYQKGVFHGAYEDHNDMVLEGGSIESDGQGTILTTSMCLLAPNRNQPLTQQEIENQLKKRLCADRILWINYGELIGDDTDGHVDTTVRLAPNNTIVYVGCDDEADEQYNDFKQMEQQLQAFRTKEGQPYRLLRLPIPDKMMHDGERLPATYANFLIINRAVIYPTYQQPHKDNKAKIVLEQAFPDREIIGIDASIVVRQHGSLHCLTMQYPQGAKILAREECNE